MFFVRCTFAMNLYSAFKPYLLTDVYSEPNSAPRETRESRFQLDRLSTVCLPMLIPGIPKICTLRYTWVKLYLTND